MKLGSMVAFPYVIVALLSLFGDYSIGNCGVGVFDFLWLLTNVEGSNFWVAVISAKNHKRQRRKRQSVAAKRESRKR